MKVMRAPWKLKDGRVIDLITPKELATLPDGTVLVDIFGVSYVTGKDPIDTDTRGGMLAYGLPSDDTYRTLTYEVEV